MIRQFPFLLLLFVLQSSFKSYSKLEELIKKSNTVEQLLIINKKFNNDRNLKIFRNVPIGVNPLNPEKLIRLSSSFGERFHPITGQKKKHLGLDISADQNLAVHVTANGEVTKIIYSNQGYGNYVEVKHKYNFVTRYAHLNVITVIKGQKVKQGDILGGVGTTGSSTGNHLHYEVIKNNRHINPEKLIQ